MTYNQSNLHWIECRAVFFWFSAVYTISPIWITKDSMPISTCYGLQITYFNRKINKIKPPCRKNGLIYKLTKLKIYNLKIAVTTKLLQVELIWALSVSPVSYIWCCQSRLERL